MATFPAGVYAPVSKAAGNTIQASFFNDPEAEIVAIEDALKNGITFPVSIAGALTVSTGGLTVSTGSVNLGGPSSLATLQVNGASTFAGPVVMSSGLTANTLGVTSTASFGSSVTFAGNVTVTGTLIAGAVTIQQPSVRVSLASNLSLSSNGETGPNWLTQDWTFGGMHSTSANSSRLTFADSTGFYVVGFTGAFDNSGNAAGSIRTARIRFNDATPVCGESFQRGSSEAIAACSISGAVRVTSTSDYVTVRVRDTNDDSINGSLLAASTHYATTFWAHKVTG